MPIETASFSPISASASLSLTHNAQGVAYDGTNYFFVTSEEIHRYTRSGSTYTLQDSSLTLLADVNAVIAEANDATQTNGAHHHSGSLWIGANNFTNVSPRGWIAQVNPTTYAVDAVHEVENHYCEGGVWHDVGSGDEIWVHYHDWPFISRYTSAFSLVANYSLPFVSGDSDLLYQGAQWLVIGSDHYLMVNLHNTNARSGLHIYLWTGSGFTEVKISDIMQTTTVYTSAATTGQGIHWETTGTPTFGTVMLFADRVSGGRIIRSTFVDGAIKDDSFTPYQDAVLADAPIAFWRGNDPAASVDAMVDFSGDVWRDGQWRGGVTLGGIALTNDSNAGSVDFNSAGTQFGLRGRQADFAGLSAITVEAIIKPDQLVERTIIGKHHSASDGEFALFLVSATTIRFMTINPSASRDDFDVTVSLVADTVYYIAATWDGTTKRVFLGIVGADDFAEVDNKAWSAANLQVTDSDLCIGAVNNAHNIWKFDGDGAEYAIYDVAVSAARLEAHYDAASELPDVTAPELLSATVSVDGTTTTLVFDENVTGQTAFTLTSDGGAVTLSPSSGDGTTTHVFSNSRVVLTGESITLDYDSGAGTSADDSANALASISGFSVTNNSTAVAPTPDPGSSDSVPGSVYRFAALRNTLRQRSQNCNDPRLTESQRLECRRRQQRISRNG